ncbi:type IIL restriction-modification enzyme MmeI [Haliangium sp.]|uniref:type IIL restriction-modification enzyme MmeI n=1 Tax=Haliangium sp. TaxID=2663208 RepID=UPI003D100E5E
MRDADRKFHEEWLGLAQPVEGLVFSVPALSDAQIAPKVRPGITAELVAHLDPRDNDNDDSIDDDGPVLRDVRAFFQQFLGYDQPSMLIERAELPAELSFYAPEGRQEIRPSFAIARRPFDRARSSDRALLSDRTRSSDRVVDQDGDDDPFADFDAPAADPADPADDDPFADFDLPPGDAKDGDEDGNEDDADREDDDSRDGGRGAGPDIEAGAGGEASPYLALVWDLGDDVDEPGAELGIDLDKSEAVTGPWRYPPTAKLDRLLRHTGVPVGLLCNRRELRLVYAPSGEASAHLSFRFADLAERAGRPLVAALELLLHARRSYGAAPEYTVEGLLSDSRRRQADVTKELAAQVFEAVEILLEGFEHAAARDCVGERPDWLRAAMEAPDDHLYQGLLSVVLRLVFLLYAEDQSLVPVAHPLYAEHLSVLGLYDRLSDDAGAHPESMHLRFGAYGRLIALFRAVFLGVQHGELRLPPRRGRLFDPNGFPFLEGGLPGWTAAISMPEERAEVALPSVDDHTVYRVLHRLVVFKGQRLSYRSLDVEQIGSVYESLIGYHVLRLGSPGVRLGKHGVWVEAEAALAMSASERKRLWKETCGLSTTARGKAEAAVKQADSPGALAQSLAELAPRRRGDGRLRQAEAGKLVLQPGEERRRTGSHYTPRWLSEKVVRRTLEPILACLGEAPTAEQILRLKICDPAMGSGAFLVAACRLLADEIVAAWDRAGETAALTEEHGDAALHARRLVAQRCLYGVDKNPAAVELAKLSLWLVTLSGELPFTFVDHALRHGDSLVGLDLEQIRSFHWAPKEQLEMCRRALEDALEQALEHRREILALADHEDAESQREKQRLLEYAELATAKIRMIADVCVGAFFAEAKAKARESARNQRLAMVERFLAGDESERAQLEAMAAQMRALHAPFHWMIEFPEVFYEERPDPLDGDARNHAAYMEAFVGNPPFLGGTMISTQLGSEYLDWLTMLVGRRGNRADLCAYFFQRAAVLLGLHGTFGLVATNTIAQGDTREQGLRALLSIGWRIYDAKDSMPWPGQAAVTVSIVHLATPSLFSGQVALNGSAATMINSRLRPTPERPDPRQLAANHALSFLGCKVGGQGFVLDAQERDLLISQHKANAERIFPYLGGEEVNSSPYQNHHRYVVDFAQMSLSDAEKWPALMEIVRREVKPYRDSVRRDTWRKRWWQFAEVYPAMRAAIAGKARCLVNSLVSKHLLFAFQPTNRIFSHKLNVMPFEAYTAFAVLQSRVHVPWAWLLSSTMKTDLNYSASDCFETFPFPQPDPRTVIPAVEAAGEALYTARASYMVDTDQGLTKTYNALKNPDCDDERILALRRLHEDMDRAVLAAYGWDDVEVPPFCPRTAAERAAVQAFEDEVIDRLYVLNAERAREEERLGLRGKGAGKPKAKKAAKKSAGKAKKKTGNKAKSAEDDKQGRLL